MYTLNKWVSLGNERDEAFYNIQDTIEEYFLTFDELHKKYESLNEVIIDLGYKSFMKFVTEHNITYQTIFEYWEKHNLPILREVEQNSYIIKATKEDIDEIFKEALNELKLTNIFR